MSFDATIYCSAELASLITLLSLSLGSETHFKVVVVSDAFEGVSLVEVRNYFSLPRLMKEN